MMVYLGKDRKCMTATMTTTHANLTGLATRTENLKHKLYTDFFPSPDLVDNLHTKTINCCDTVRQNPK